MSLSVTISGSSVSIKDKSLTITDALNQRSQCTFVVEDASGTNHYQFGQPVVVSDSTNGVLFAGFVNQSDEQKLVPNPNAEIKITCMDNHYRADKRRVTKDYQNMAAGDIATDLLSSYLAAEGVTAGYAYKRTSTQTEWGAGGLTGVTNALNVGDGDLELSPIGSTVTKTETTTSDFAAGTLTNVDAQSNQLNLHASNALKFTATNVGNLGNTYLYWMIWTGSQAIASGDTFQYDVWISSTSPAIQAGVDFVCTDGTTARDFASQGIVDQLDIGLHPGSDLKGLANDQWYTRIFDLTAMAGKTIAFVTIAFEGDAGGNYQAYFKNIKQFDSLGTLKATFYDGQANPYTPSAVTLSANQIVSDNGYTSISVTNATVYDKTGNRVSPAISIDAAKIPKSSLVTWTSLIPAGVTPPTATSGQTNPVIPTGTSMTVYTSVDNKATWQACSFKQAVPDLMAGVSIASRNLYTKVVMSITGTTPEVTPQLADLTVTVVPSWSSTKHDAISTFAVQTDFNLGTYSNTQWDTAYNWQALDLTSYCQNYDNPIYSQSLFGSSSPAARYVRKQWRLSTNTGTDVRSRIDETTATWQNFTLQVSVTIQATGNYGAGVCYRTTGWQNANDTYAYTAMLNQNPHATGISYIQLGRGTNTGGGAGAYTNISEVALPFVLASGSTYALTVVVNGSSHKVYVDGILYLNATDATYAAAGQIALRVYNNTGATQTGTFDNFGVANALTGTWTSPTISIGPVVVGNVGNSMICWDADTPPPGCSLLVQVSADGGAYATATNGGTIPGVTTGALGPGTIQIKVTFTVATADQAESLTLHGLTVWVTNQTSASGNRVSNGLSCANVGRAGNAQLTVNSVLPTGATLGLDISPDGVTWTMLTNAATAQYTTALPASILYAQPDPWLDSFAANSSASYTQTTFNSGSAATWTWDTANARLIGVAGVRGVLQYPGFSRADMYVEGAFNYSDQGGLFARMVDTSNLYFITLRDSGATSNPNRVILKKNVAGTITTLVTYNLPVAWTRGDWHIFRLDVQGSAITVSMDNVAIISTTDTSITAAGTAGVVAGLASGDTVQVYSLRVQTYGDNVSSLSLYSRLRLSSADPTVTPQLTDMTLSVHDPNIGVGATVSTTAWSGVGSQMFQVSQALDDLAKQSTSPAQFVWHIGTSSPPRLYFHQQQAVAAPFYLYSGGSGAANGSGGNILAVSPPVVSRPDMLYRNRQTIDGGFDTTTLIHEQRKGDGVTQAWPMTWPLASVPTVTLTAPAINLAGQPETVGVQGVDTGKDFYWQSGNNVISQDVSETPPASTDTLDFYYYGQIPVRVTRDNTNGTGTYAGTVGQTQLAAIDGTSGIVEDYEQVPGLNKAQATAIADARLVQYGKLGLSWQFMTTQFGLAPGQLAFARVAEHGITNQPFLISQVQTTAQGAAVAGGILYEYTVQLTSGPVLGSYEVFFGKAFTGSVA